MSFNSLAAQVRDAALLERIGACVNQEARENPTLAGTRLGVQVSTLMVEPAPPFIWPVALATEAEYESALAADNPDPGGDPAVITDQAIVSAVQANWPTP